MSPGMGKTNYVKKAKAQGINIIDSDDLLAAAITAAGYMPEDYNFPPGTVVSNENVGAAMGILYSKVFAMPEGKAKSEAYDKLEGIYAKVYMQMRTAASKGATVLTGQARFAETSDFVFVYEFPQSNLIPTLKVKTMFEPGNTELTQDEKVQKRFNEIVFTENKSGFSKIIVLPLSAQGSVYAEEILTKGSRFKPGQKSKKVEALNRGKLKEDALDNEIVFYKDNPRLYTIVNEEGDTKVLSPKEFSDLLKEAASKANVSTEFIESIDSKLGVTSDVNISQDDKGGISSTDPDIQRAIDAAKKAKDDADKGNFDADDEFDDESKPKC